MKKTDNNFHVDVPVDPADQPVSVAGFHTEIRELPAKSRRAMFLVLGMIGLILILSIAGLFLILSGGDDNPLRLALGITSENLSGVLFAVLGFLSGGIGIAGLLLGMFGIFKLMNAPKAENKKPVLLFTVVGILIALLGIVGVLFSFSAIGAEDVSNEVIATNPKYTRDLTAPVTVTFSGEFVPVDRTKYNIITYDWNFGDGEIANGMIVTHTFLQKPISGIYTVELKLALQDRENSQAGLEEVSFTRLVSILDEAMFASFVFSPERGDAPLQVTFDATGSRNPRGEIMRYEWDFNGDGISDAEGKRVSHVFEKDGDFPVNLTVFDKEENFNTQEQIVSVGGVHDITPEIAVSPQDLVLIPAKTYEFDASGSFSKMGNITKYSWNIGGTINKEGRKISHNFDVEGIVPVKLILEDDRGNQRTYVKEFAVDAGGNGIFGEIITFPAKSDETGIVSGETPLQVTFDAGKIKNMILEAPIMDYEWNFGNGEKSAGQTVEHTFLESGVYDVSLKITAKDGKTREFSQMILVGGETLQAILSSDVTNGIIPLTVRLDASASMAVPNDPIVAYEWDFGDGTSTTTSTPLLSHKFTETGVFGVKMTAVTESNNKTSIIRHITVTNPPLSACFEMSRTSGKVPLTVTFDPKCSTGMVNKYAWKFDLLGTSSERKPTFTFTEDGSYLVELEIDDGSSNISRFSSTVHAEGVSPQVLPEY